MKLWMSGELWHEVADMYRVTRNYIEPAINMILESYSFGDGVIKIAYIAIIGASEEYSEIRRYSKKNKVLEFRLRIPMNEFMSASDSKRLHIVCNSLARCVSLSKELNVPNFDQEIFEKVFLEAIESVQTGT